MDFPDDDILRTWMHFTDDTNNTIIENELLNQWKESGVPLFVYFIYADVMFLSSENYLANILSLCTQDKLGVQAVLIMLYNLYKHDTKIATELRKNIITDRQQQGGQRAGGMVFHLLPLFLWCFMLCESKNGFKMMNAITSMRETAQKGESVLSMIDGWKEGNIKEALLDTSQVIVDAETLVSKLYKKDNILPVNIVKLNSFIQDGMETIKIINQIKQSKNMYTKTWFGIQLARKLPVYTRMITNLVIECMNGNVDCRIILTQLDKIDVINEHIETLLFICKKMVSISQKRGGKSLKKNKKKKKTPRLTLRLSLRKRPLFQHFHLRHDFGPHVGLQPRTLLVGVQQER